MGTQTSQSWAAARPAASVLHLDTAAVGRSSRATLAAVSAHAAREAEVGGYVAEAEAGERLDALRLDVAGMLGTDTQGVAFVEGAMAAFVALLGAWPLPARARVAVAPAEWGPNLEVLAAHGCVIELLEVDESGVIDLDALGRRLVVGPPDLVLVDQVAAHRGLVQPAVDVVRLGRANGVPVWVDAAQALGQVAEVAAADAVFATSRKWLTGPRGVGVVAVAEQHRPTLRVRRPAKHPDRAPVRCLEPDEAHVAGRVGLGVAVSEHLGLGPARVEASLAEVGAITREALASVAGWEVVHPHAPAVAITALRPAAGQDVERTRDRLHARHGILTSACLPWRAPRERPGCGSGRGSGGGPGAGSGAGSGPLLRVSPHVDLDTGDLERLCRALADD